MSEARTPWNLSVVDVQDVCLLRGSRPQLVVDRRASIPARHTAV